MVFQVVIGEGRFSVCHTLSQNFYCKLYCIMPLMKDFIIYAIIACIGFLVRKLPAHVALSLGARLGSTMYSVLKKRREITMSNLRLAFGGERTEDELKLIAIRSYRNLGKNFAEFLRFPLLTKENIYQLVTVRGRENLDRAFQLSGKAIAFIPHLGNWELLAPVYSVLLSKVAVIIFPLNNRYLDRLVNEYRSKLGIELIKKRQAARHVLRALRSGYGVGFVADQNAGREGVFVDFFGKLASTVRGPVAIALKTGAPLLFSIDIRQPDDKHLVIISEPIKLEVTGDFDRDVAHNTAKLMAELESYIRRYPCQWMWQHDRWKTQPDTEWQRKRSHRKLSMAHKRT